MEIRVNNQHGAARQAAAIQAIKIRLIGKHHRLCKRAKAGNIIFEGVPVLPIKASGEAEAEGGHDGSRNSVLDRP
mgnify:CR=1 FL=1